MSYINKIDRRYSRGCEWRRWIALISLSVALLFLTVIRSSTMPPTSAKQVLSVSAQTEDDWDIFDQNKVVVLSGVREGTLDLAYNFLCSMGRFNVRMPAQIPLPLAAERSNMAMSAFLAFDEHAYDSLRRIDASVVVPRSRLTTSRRVGPSIRCDDECQCEEKMKSACDIVELGHAVLWLDVGSVWFEDATSIAERLLKEATRDGVDMYVVKDPHRATHKVEWMPSSAAFFMRSTAATARFCSAVRAKLLADESCVTHGQGFFIDAFRVLHAEVGIKSSTQGCGGTEEERQTAADGEAERKSPPLCWSLFPPNEVALIYTDSADIAQPNMLVTDTADAMNILDTKTLWFVESLEDGEDGVDAFVKCRAEPRSHSSTSEESNDY